MNSWLLLNRKLVFFLIVVVTILLGLALVYYYYVLLPSPSVEEDPPEILGHFSSINMADSVKFFVIEGIVQNNLNSNAYINVTATFYDVQNNTFLKEVCSPTELKILKPGQKSPFKFFWLLDSSEPRYELDLAYAKTSEQSIDVLEFIGLTNQTENGWFVIRGEVLNKRFFKAEGVVVKCAYYNAEGNLSGLSGIYIRSIDGGGGSPFEIKIDLSKNPVDYDLIVFAIGYEELSIANYVLFTFLVLVLLGFVIFMKRRGW